MTTKRTDDFDMTTAALLAPANREIDRLRAVNEELVEALETALHWWLPAGAIESGDHAIAKTVLAKAKEA